ncbi:MAG: hypothetical protein ACM3Z4_08590 [Hyphomicrobiales bacterium]
MPSSRELQRKAEQARERLSERLTGLSNQLSPAAMMSDLLTIDYDKTRQEVTQFLSKHVRANPMAYALIAAGVGWLLVSEVRETLPETRAGTGASSRRCSRRAKRPARSGRKTAAKSAAKPAALRKRAS